MFNGHLTASNSDIRVGDNPSEHDGRWPGSSPGGRRLGSLEGAAPSADLLNPDRPVAPTPLPPDRPSGASPDVEDAAQEFLTDWLVRRKYDQALEFLSPHAYACLNSTKMRAARSSTPPAARRELRE